MQKAVELLEAKLLLLGTAILDKSRLTRQQLLCRAAAGQAAQRQLQTRIDTVSAAVFSAAVVPEPGKEAVLAACETICAERQAARQVPFLREDVLELSANGWVKRPNTVQPGLHCLVCSMF